MSDPTTRPLLGVVTIGQSPRPDLAATFGHAAPHADVRVVGALDGLPAHEIAALTAPGSYPLLVRLADGTSAEIPRDHLVPRVAACARGLAADGARLVVVACAGEFPAIECEAPVLVPGRVVPAVVRSLCEGGRVGVVTPNAAQVPFAERKWRADGFDVVVTHGSPILHADLAPAAAVFRDTPVAMVVLDCMGHDDAYRDRFARLCGCPVVAAQSLVARLAAALL